MIYVGINFSCAVKVQVVKGAQKLCNYIFVKYEEIKLGTLSKLLC